MQRKRICNYHFPYPSLKNIYIIKIEEDKIAHGPCIIAQIFKYSH